MRRRRVSMVRQLVTRLDNHERWGPPQTQVRLVQGLRPQRVPLTLPFCAFSQPRPAEHPSTAEPASGTVKNECVSLPGPELQQAALPTDVWVVSAAAGPAHLRLRRSVCAWPARQVRMRSLRWCPPRQRGICPESAS